MFSLGVYLPYLSAPNIAAGQECPVDMMGVVYHVLLYNRVQMFEPFQDRNPHFFGTVSLS